MSCMRIAARICACIRVSVCVCVDKIRILYRYCILRWTVQIQLPNGIYSLSIFLLFSIIKTTKWMGVYSFVRLFACFCSFFLQQLHTNHMKTIDAKECVYLVFMAHERNRRTKFKFTFTKPKCMPRDNKNEREWNNNRSIQNEREACSLSSCHFFFSLTVSHLLSLSLFLSFYVFLLRI